MAGKKGMKWGNKIRNPRTAEEMRAKIEAGKIINALKSYVHGETEMEPAQVTAALGLLRKVLPDKAETEHTGESTVVHVLDSGAVLGRLVPELAGRDETQPPEGPTVQ